MAESSPGRDVTEDDVLNLLRSAPSTGALPGADDAGPRRWALREKTALVSAFDAAELEEDGPGEHTAEAALREFLSHDCERVTTRQGRRWRLLPAARTTTLERLGTPDRLLAALRSGAGTGQDTARDCAERLLTGTARPLGELRLEELHAALTVAGWLDDAPRARAALAARSLTLPGTQDISRHIELARLFQPLDALADATFCGRERELGELARHVRTGADGPPGRPPWLLIHGPGGVGKSTLVARFVLDGVTRARPSHGRPYAYLPFDRTDLVPEQPLTVLGEMLRQLPILLPALDGPAVPELQGAVRTTLEADSRAESELRGTRGPRTGRRSDETALVARFAHLVTGALRPGNRPVLLVLDTFEQAQRKGAFTLARLLDFLEVLQDLCPWLRIIAAGRAPVDDGRFAHVPLEGFDPATAESYLRRLLPGGGREYEAALQTVIRTVGSDPLSLKLAADLFRREGPQALRDASLRRQVQLRLQPEERQGILYRRILDHLDDPGLRRIASPGLTVRRVTPDVIRHVLAGPCGLGEVDERRARTLFRRLREEAALVEETPGREAVVHRADVRRVMLPMLRGEGRTLVHRIHRKAVAYYADLAERDPVNAVEHRAEELYHRLCLGQSARTLDRRWLSGAGQLLDSALEELPVRGRIYLSERLGITVAPDLLRQADDDTWARQALRAGTACLAEGRAEETLLLLDERPDHVGGDVELAALRIRALTVLGRMVEARELVEPALELASRLSDARGFVEIAVSGARIDEDLGRFGAARALLRQARRAAEPPGLGEALPLSVAVAELRLHRREDRADSVEARRLRDEVVERVSRLGSRERARHPALVRELAAEVGDHVPELVSQAARLLGVDVQGAAGKILRTSLSDDDVRDLAEVTRAAKKEPAARREDDDEADTGQEDNSSTWLAGHNSTVRGEVVGAYIDSRAERQPSWHHALVNTYQYEVDQASYTRSRSGSRPGSAVPMPGAGRDAVVVVPGFMGSALEDTDSGRRLWGHDAIAGLLDVWWRNGARALELTADERAGDTRRVRPGGLLRTPAWAPLFGGLEPYGRLLRTVRDSVVHPDAVLEFSYDWRLSAAHNAALLTQAATRHLERWRAHPEVARTGGGAGYDAREPRLVFVAHSTGGLVVRAAMARGLAEVTRQVLCLGTPFRGVPKALEVLRPYRNSGPAAVPSLALRQIMRTLPGFYDLLPDYRCVEHHDGEVRRLELDDIGWLGGDTALARDAMRTRRDTDAASLVSPVQAVVGSGQPTVQSVRLRSDGTVLPLLSSVRMHNDGEPVRDQHGNLSRWDLGGDGVVPCRSASSPTRGDFFVPVQYGALTTHRTVLTWVRDMLSEGHVAEAAPGSSGRGLARALPDDGGIGLPSSDRHELSLSLSDVVEAGQRCMIQVRGARSQVPVRCDHIDGLSPSIVAVVRRYDDEDVVAEVTFPAPGLYRVTVEEGNRSAGQVVLVVDPEDGD
ncbi:hypothetical protein A4E84_32000 [Streptomyces qaidamensis]|uniref:Orc1-like AAA ATPase domain-containing protein n=1 Tax=Streptomyces qaidamensis TaxID=1783515 RepID=A0A143C910_9ACTN|nr:AAA family ATPase [Streptomyces qaidamensis]AMW13729.1 hypothetical protein A4E84_32000 [Streptomyces qaidamensis]